MLCRLPLWEVATEQGTGEAFPENPMAESIPGAFCWGRKSSLRLPKPSGSLEHRRGSRLCPARVHQRRAVMGGAGNESCSGWEHHPGDAAHPPNLYLL